MGFLPFQTRLQSTPPRQRYKSASLDSLTWIKLPSLGQDPDQLARIDTRKLAVFVGHPGERRGRGQHRERNDQGRRTKADHSAIWKVTYRPWLVAFAPVPCAP